MIEHVNRTRPVLSEPGFREENLEWEYNFPRAALLEISYRARRQIENQYLTEEWITGLQITFGSGNPPDFGYGNLQSTLLRMPNQEIQTQPREQEVQRAESVLKNAEAQVPVGEANVTAAKAQLAALEAQEANAKTGAETAQAIYNAEATPANKLSLVEASGTFFQAEAATAQQHNTIKQAEAELASLKAAVAQAQHAENAVRDEVASTWTSRVTASYSRPFNAVRFKIIIPESLAFTRFDFEEDITVYRTEDLSAQPITLAGASGGG